MSNEAKALGIKRGTPLFKMRDIVEANNVATLSGNHRLYGDMSSRVMATISEVIPEIEVYSVDECFIRFDRWPVDDLNTVGHDIVRRVRRNTGIPTSLGIAPTKTLAKAASIFAKKYPGYHSVCIIDDEAKRRKALSMLPVDDIWGVGRRIGRKMHAAGIETALDFANMTRSQVKRRVNVAGERTWRELNGEPCIEMELTAPDKKQICCSRSFEKMIFDLESLTEAMAAFATIVSRKLREQGSVAVSLSVFIHTNSFREDLDQYYASNFRALPEPTNDTMTITAAAVDALRPIFRRGYGFKKAGIIITEIVSASNIQQSLFEPVGERQRRRRLMAVVDAINAGAASRDMVHVATRSPLESYVRCQHASRRYSTRLSDIIVVKSGENYSFETN